jgi:hypothetical protein
MSNDQGGEPSLVRVIDIKMSFSSMVVFMVKAAIAAIPALIILTVLGTIVVSFLFGLTGLGGHKPVANSLPRERFEQPAATGSGAQGGQGERQVTQAEADEIYKSYMKSMGAKPKQQH